MESNNSKNSETIKFFCSYGILPRYTVSTLRYANGLTCVLAVDRSISSQLMVKLREFYGSLVNLRCQLPTSYLETLISITSDEDLVNVIQWNYRASSSSMNNRPLKVRAVFSPPKSLKQVSSLQTPPESLRNLPSFRFAPQTHSLPVGYSAALRIVTRKLPI